MFAAIVLVLLLLIIGFFSTRGIFSTAIALVSAVFASVLAMGLFEPLSGIVGSYKPAFARGVTFLLIYLLGFSLIGLIADYAIPKTIRFTPMIDKIGGGVLGIFVSLIVMGSALIGIDMLPLHTQILWFNRYPAATGMQGDSSAITGIPADPENFWLAPDRFTMAVWNGASGRALGGEQPFDSIHPDIRVESYGYRNTVEYASKSVLPPSLFAVDSAYVSDSPEELAKCHITDTTKQAAVIRIDVTQGTEQPKLSADEDAKFRITATEVRLVTDKGNQYYPIGLLQNHPGAEFLPMPLDSGHLVDDYVGGRVIEDWVFQLEKNEKPAYIEVKELARAYIGDKLASKPVPLLAADKYPQRAYLYNDGGIHVTVHVPEGALAGAEVYVVDTTTKVGVVGSEVQTAHDRLVTMSAAFNNGEPPWNKAAGMPGVFSEGDFRIKMTNARNEVTLKNKDDNVSWEQVIPPILVGYSSSDGPTNINSLPIIFTQHVVPLLNAVNTTIRAHGKTDTSGSVELAKIPPGHYDLIVEGRTDVGYYCWVLQQEIVAKTITDRNITLNDSGTFAQLKKP